MVFIGKFVSQFGKDLWAVGATVEEVLTELESLIDNDNEFEFGQVEWFKAEHIVVTRDVKYTITEK